MIRRNAPSLLLTLALSAMLACGARPKTAPNDEVTTPLTMEDERALEEGVSSPDADAPAPNKEPAAKP